MPHTSPSAISQVIPIETSATGGCAISANKLGATPMPCPTSTPGAHSNAIRLARATQRTLLLLTGPQAYQPIKAPITLSA
jgi:hypothetical protein